MRYVSLYRNQTLLRSQPRSPLPSNRLTRTATRTDNEGKNLEIVHPSRRRSRQPERIVTCFGCGWSLWRKVLRKTHTRNCWTRRASGGLTRSRWYGILNTFSAHNHPSHMIEFQQVCKGYGAQTVLDNASFTVNPGEHVGVVGPNGAGKSTLFGLIVGEVSADAGKVTVPSQCRLGYLRQHMSGGDTSSCLLDYVENAIPELRRIQHEMNDLEHAFHDGEVADRERALKHLGELQTRFESMGGYDLKTRAEVTLGGLGFPEEQFSLPVAELSGGWQMRAELARALVAIPEILLLDEPSNYLDIPAVEWLQRYLREFQGTLLLVSHDRYLLNSLTSATIEIDHGTATRYAGNYDRYVVEREQRMEQSLAARKNEARRREQVERFIERFRAKNTMATRVKSKIKMLEKMDATPEMRRVSTKGHIRLRPPPHCGHEIMRLEEAGLTYDDSRWVLRGVDLRLEKGEKIALVGLNGMGKTTLLRMLTGQLPLSAGKRVVGHKVVTGYQSQEFADTMSSEATVFEIVKRHAPDMSDGEVRSLLGGFGFSGDAVEKTVGILSGGEKVRVAFARLLANPPNFLVLDEPTTHLDIAAREALEDALSGYEGTLCIVSHDIAFVRRVANGIISMEPPGIRRWPGGYDYYREKSAAENASSTPAPTRTAPARDSSVDKKAQRRERAQRRQELHSRTKNLKKRIARTEKQIETFEAERETVVASLSAAEPGTDFASLNQRLATIQTEIAAYTNRWENLATELEEITAEFE